jgi:hypothetical protein
MDFLTIGITPLPYTIDPMSMYENNLTEKKNSAQFVRKLLQLFVVFCGFLPSS